MKILLLLAILLLYILIPATVSAESSAEWAYAAMPLNSENSGVGTIYFASGHFTAASVNPITAAAYTENELADIIGGASEADERYRFDVPSGARSGLSIYGLSTVYWYDADNTAAIVSHADPLRLNAETGEVVTADGTMVAFAMARTCDWAYAAMPLNSEAYHIGSIYYASSCFTTDAVNPLTAAKYTEAEISAVFNGYIEGAKGYTKNLPEDALIGINVYGTEDILWFDAENSKAILSHADPLTLNAETGEMLTADGTVAAIAMRKSFRPAT